MKKRGKALVTALGLAALVTGISLAQPGGFGGGGHPAMGGGHGGGGPAMEGEIGGFVRVLGALDLTDEQREEIGGIMEGARDEIMAIRESFQGINPREELMELFLRDNLTLGDVQAVFYEIDQVQEQVRDVMLEAFVDIHDVLTPEQLERLGEIIEQHHGMGGGPGMGGPGMGGPGMGGPPPAQGGHGFGF
jgi:Spy/CpxP family protein refolding chaperone